MFFYAVLGWFAATTGTALSIVMTSAWVNLGFALVFAYFGLSMLGLCEFPLLSSLATHLEQATSQRGGLVGTFLMGTTAGLGISPCIGPVVGAILLEISGQTAGASGVSPLVTTSVTLRGVALMTSFGVGLGLPFLVVGMLSHWVGQPGPWLTKVKFVLGLPILYVAYMYYLKSMDIAGVPEPVAHAMLLGVVAIGLAVFIGDFYRLGANPSHSARVRGALGIVLLIVGIYFLYNGLGRSGILIPAAVSRQDGTLVADTVPLRACRPLVCYRRREKYAGISAGSATLLSRRSTHDVSTSRSLWISTPRGAPTVRPLTTSRDATRDSTPHSSK